MRKLFKLAVLGVAVALGVWVWGVLFPSPEKVIRGRIQEIAELVSFPPNERPLTALSSVQRLCSLASPDVEIRVEVPGAGRGIVQGREELRQGAMAFRSTVNGAKVKFPDVSVALAADRQSAEVLVTVEARVATEPDTAILEMKLAFQKLDGHWLVTRAETVKTLR